MATNKILALLGGGALLISAKTIRSPTPPMGWNSYNSYSCSPSEDKIKTSANGLVALGLDTVGYNFVTVDCGWPSRDRDAEGRLQWNETLFPSGGAAMGEFLHGLGLGFGLYSGAGYLQCGSTDLPASLGFEDVDARRFEEWGGDSLKYDNCYATSSTTMVDSDSAESQSPGRFETMATSLDNLDRDMHYFICQWGIGQNVGSWASKIGNTWRMSNDIYNAWRSIWRITNEVVPYYRHTTIGAFADMDMLIVGLNALSIEEERFHFGMWAMNKSPLIIGAVMDPAKLSPASLAILENKEVIAINQDPLATQARLVQRYTEEEWDIWLGNLSGSRKVLGVANWRNDSRSVEVDLSTIGIGSASARDVWAAAHVGTVSGVQKLDLAGHELKLWILSDMTPTTAPLQSSGYHSIADAILTGSANLTPCATDACLPTHQKASDINSDAHVSFHSVSARSAGKKIISVDYINYDYAFKTAWDWGDNTRNMTIQINNGTAKRWAFPISGGDWWETGSLIVDMDGFVQGDNHVVFSGARGDTWAPDLVGFELLE
ncbi:carbohydrate-binding module family 35 protein [Pleomassaria siparia CBS 279.74]|uniref:Alpha-galactosidase n=1 Tax=Pleomassaria siparia CBS 279.74 TaxID=1314801 RepID=A0A6G1JQR8_9PLEO|nr:carbohydrate-binding module family 35 protein [Pleomassaria siparia CBS 279.74]